MTGPAGDDRREEGSDETREREEGRDLVATVEWTVTAASVGFTLLLIGVVVWQSLTVPADIRPRTTIVGVETGPAGSVDVTVELVNAGSVGLASATVELDCADPPLELVFEHVPASGRRQGTVVCPAGTADPNATVVGWEGA